LKNRVISILALVAVLCSMALVSNTQVSASVAAQATAAANQSAVTARVIVAELSLRTQPTIRANRVAILKAGASVTVLGQTTSGFWYQVNTSDNQTGWIGSAYVILTSGRDADVPVVNVTIVPDTICDPVAINARVNSVEGLSLRSQPSIQAEKLDLLRAGTAITIIGQNSAGTWYLVQTADKRTGWVGSAYVFIPNRSRVNDIPIVDPSAGPATPSVPAGCETPGAATPDAGATPDSAATEPATVAFKGRVNTDALRVRANPSTDSDTLKVLKANEIVTVLAQNQAETWLQVETADGIVGWVGSAYVFLESGKLSDVPKIQPAPAG
jgi:uncharacterized protein YgiM (DUF1202 family)